MDNIALNFVPLLRQDNRLTVYRKPVPNTSQTKNLEDFRVRLPEQAADSDWTVFDVSTVKQNGYEPYEFEYTLNPILTVHLIHQEFLRTLNNQDAVPEHYIPQRISTKAVHFVTKKFDKGSTEIIVKPYFLKIKEEYGFLVEHKLALKSDQPFNKQTQIRNYSLDRSGRPNIYFYKDKKSNIETFIKNTLSPLLASSNLSIGGEFSSLQTKQLDVKTYLVGDKKTAKSQFMGIRSNGPYRPMDDDIRYLFLFTEKTRLLARYIYLGLIGKLFPDQFSGLEKMFSMSIRKEIVEHHLVSSFDAEAIQTSEKRVQRLKKSYPNSKLMLVAVLPKGFKGTEAPFDAYAYLKLLALKYHDVYCQVITEDTFSKRDQLKWSISNIGLQIFSKLGGVPWLVQPAEKNCLIFGLGSVQETIHGNSTRYTAYTVCLDSSGDFKYIKQLSSSSDEATYLDNLQTSLKDVLLSKLEDHYKSLVLHLPYKISRKEIKVVKAAVSQIRPSAEYAVIIIRINTKHSFVGFSDHNTCVPYEGTYIQISKNEFLVWSDGLQHGKEILHKRVPEPLYVNFIESQEERATKRECLQDIFNLAGANWRGFNSKAQPISILYSRLIAKFMKEFCQLKNPSDINIDPSDINIVSAESKSPWFL